VRNRARLPLEQLAPYFVGTPDEPAPLDFRALFGDARSVELEVGFGKGLFLVTAGQARPDVGFLGVEVERKYVLFTATRLAKRGLRNVRVACADARAFLRDRISSASLDAVHVYFPDPWWKTRHRKRRVFTEEFAAQVERVLQPGGRLHLVSDVAEYFEVMMGIQAARSGMQRLPPPDPKHPAHDLDYLTNFERKYRKEGRPIHRADYVRLPDP
jgi:tRNA (guanine-N7-)-methyltransferase